MNYDLGFRSHLRPLNVERCRLWHPGFPAPEHGWTGADWSNAMCGEAGEAANVVKKLRRAEAGHVGANDPSVLELRSQLAAELADTITYADLLAAFYELDLAAAIANKFNRVSEREGFPQRMHLQWANWGDTLGA